MFRNTTSYSTSIESNTGNLDFFSFPLALNGSAVRCVATFDFERIATSEECTIILQGQKFCIIFNEKYKGNY